MKLTYSFTIAKANMRGNSRGKLISTLMLVMTASLTLVSVFARTMAEGVDYYQNEIRSRTLDIYPINQLLTEDVIEQIRALEHVESVYINDEIALNIFDLERIGTENGEYKELSDFIKENPANVELYSLIEGEQVDVTEGKNLEESPDFCCLVPHLFYPEYYDVDIYKDALPWMDARKMIGKTLDLSVHDCFFLFYNAENGEGTGTPTTGILPPFRFKLKVVGVYYLHPASFFNPNAVVVSHRTGRAIQQMAIENSGQGGFIREYNERKEFHNYYVVVDDRKYLNEVYNCLVELNVECDPHALYEDNGSMARTGLLFRFFGHLLLVGTLILGVLNLFWSTSDMLLLRKGELGLLKAVGYRNSAIFRCFILEQLMLTLRGFAAGACISALVIGISNLVNTHTGYENRLYVVHLKDYGIYLGYALALALLLPLACEVLMLHRLTRIRPADAMR